MHGYSKVCNRLNKKDEDSRYNEEEKKNQVIYVKIAFY